MKRKPQDNLVGKFCRTSDGHRVLVEGVGDAQAGLPARALVRYIEGDKKGSRGSYFVSNLELLGSEIPIDENQSPEPS